MRRHELAWIGALARRLARIVAALRHLRRVETILHERHPQIAALPAFVDEPDAAGDALAFLDHRPGQRAEEAHQVRLAHEQIDRVIDDVGLHLGNALRACAARGLANQRRPQYLGIVGVNFGRRRRPQLGAL